MSALQVEQLKLGDEEPERLPQILLEVCAAISVKEEPIKTLVTSMQGIFNFFVTFFPLFKIIMVNVLLDSTLDI